VNPALNDSVWVETPHIWKDIKFKSQTSAGKVILLLFWDCNGSILEHYHEQGTTVTAALYTEILKSKLKPAFHNKHSGLLSRGVLLLHDNTLPHFMACTIEAIRQLKFELLPLPPHSPDLAPSDYHVFGPLKEALSVR